MRNVREIVDWSKQTIGRLRLGEEAETLSPLNAPIGYACPTCGEVYTTLERAKECRNQPFDDGGLKLGDIVIVPEVNSYLPEDPWTAFKVPPVSGSTDHIELSSYWTPFMVVTAIHSHHQEKHRCVVSLITIIDSKLWGGWNPANGQGHNEIFTLDNRPRNRKGHNDYWVDRLGDLLTNCVVPEQVKREAAALTEIGISLRSLL